MSHSRLAIEVLLEEDGAPSAMGEEIAEGLRNTPKTLPSKYFYDARGSKLFERIMELEEYYPTRTEQAILEERAAEMASIVRPLEVVELGSGSAKKTRLLIAAARNHGDLRRYMPLEVSEAIVRRSAKQMVEEFPGLEVHAVVADYEHHLDQIPKRPGRLVAFLGGTIGNFEREEAVKFLKNVASMLGRDGTLLLGTDLVKDKSVLEAAYNDSEGVTAQFNLNILNVVNRYLEGNFDPDAFEHVAFFDDEKKRIEMHLRSLERQIVRLGSLDLEISFDKGEMMRTEISQKFTRSSVARLLEEAGLKLDRWFTDPEKRYALSLSSASTRIRLA